MEVVNQRSALLSNYEVLTLLRELESDHLARSKTALRIKKEEEAAGLSPKHQAIQYLSADYQPTASQSSEGIAKLTRSLAQWDLTKAEKLQVVNLAPTEPVELYVIVEELEDRFGDQMETILGTVKESLHEHAAAINTSADGAQPTQAVHPDAVVYSECQEDYQDDGHWDYDANEVVFDDAGEGAGIEGDLDVEED